MTDPTQRTPAEDTPDGRTSNPEQTTAPERTSVPEPASRPRPRYGELAEPEAAAVVPSAGSVTSADAATQHEAQQPTQHTASATPAAAAAPTPAAAHTPQADRAQQNGEVPSRLPGVPHNLGHERQALPRHSTRNGGVHRAGDTAVPSSAPGGDTRTTDGAATQPAADTAQPAQQAKQPASATQHGPLRRAAAQRSGAGRASANRLPAQSLSTKRAAQLRADRFITIALLAVGAFGALTMANSMLMLKTSAHIMVSAVADKSLSVPEFIGPLGQITAVALLGCWALALLWSLARLRATKIAFWVPLTLGVTATVLTVAVTAIMMFNTLPQQVLLDPNQMQQLIDALTAANSNS